MKTENTIREELNSIAPVLASVVKQESEAIPEAFFSALNEKVFGTIRLEEQQKELQLIAPLLVSLEKKNRESVPPAFFVRMQEDTWKQIHASSKPTKITVSDNPSILDRMLDALFKPSFALGFAACCGLLFCSTLFFSNTTELNVSAITSGKQLTNSEIQAYIAENNDEFDEALLIKDADAIEDKTILENSSLKEEELKSYYNNELNNDKI